MPFYKKRPVVIEAQEWDGSDSSTHEIQAWAAWNKAEIKYHVGTHEYVGLHYDGERMTTEEYVPRHFTIETLEGTMKAQVGDFIIRGVKGEFYPCKPDIFHQTYERI